jgi:hypothetical protein
MAVSVAPTLSEVLTSPAILPAFRSFTELQHSEENLLFWLDAEEFRKIENPEDLKTKAKEILDVNLSFFSSSSLHFHHFPF